jgi:hypothetical protein
MMTTSFIVTCPCGQKNRALIAKRSRCGKCKREFTTHELTQAAMVASIFEALGPKVDKIQWADDNGNITHEENR